MRIAAFCGVSFVFVTVLTTRVWADDWLRICLDHRNEVIPDWDDIQLSNNYYSEKTSLTANCYQNEVLLEWSNGELHVIYIDLKSFCRNYTNAAQIDNIVGNDGDFHSSTVITSASWDECIFFGCYEKQGGNSFYTFMPVSCSWSQEVCDPESSDCNQSITTCNTTTGNSVCSCYAGYSGNGSSCTNIDECSEGRDTCSETNSTCFDTIGAYTCECNSGYDGPVTNCTNIDECTLGTHSCHHDATCADTPGEFNCTCNSGFEGDGFNCTNIDECVTNSHNCHQKAACIDTVGSFSCICTEGYEGNGVSCINIDECTLDTHSCHYNATCADTPGEFNCTCKSGFEGDGFNCTNVNECMTDRHDCHQNAVCSDNVGGFKCNCEKGYEGDGVLCTNSTGVSTFIGLIAVTLLLIPVLTLSIAFLICKIKKRYNGRYFIPQEKLRCDPHCKIVDITAPPFMITGSIATLISEFDDLHFESTEKSINRDKLDIANRIKETPISLQENGSSEHCSSSGNEYIIFASENSCNTAAENCNAEMAELQSRDLLNIQTVPYVCESDISGQYSVPEASSELGFHPC